MSVPLLGSVAFLVRWGHKRYDCLLWVHIHALSCMTIIQLSISFFFIEANVQPGHRKQVWTAHSNPSVLLPQCLPVWLSYVLSTLRPCSPSHAPFSRHDFASTLSQCSQVGSSPRAGFSILNCPLESLSGVECLLSQCRNPMQGPTYDNIKISVRPS